MNGLESKLNTLQTFLSKSKSAMDVIAITETSEHVDQSFVSNVNIDGYSLYSTPSRSKKGGTALYVRKAYDVFERNNLKVQQEDLMIVTKI